jgi:hypothetical protein
MESAIVPSQSKRKALKSPAGRVRVIDSFYGDHKDCHLDRRRRFCRRSGEIPAFVRVGNTARPRWVEATEAA